MVYNADGAEIHRASAPFSSMFVLRQGSGDHWLIVDEVESP